MRSITCTGGTGFPGGSGGAGCAGSPSGTSASAGSAGAPGTLVDAVDTIDYEEEVAKAKGLIQRKQRRTLATSRSASSPVQPISEPGRDWPSAGSKDKHDRATYNSMLKNAAAVFAVTAYKGPYKQ